MKGRMLDLSRGMDGKWRLTIALPGTVTHVWDELHEKEVSVEIKQYREKRSRDANAYFHVLVNKIAAAQGLSDTEVKRLLVNLRTDRGSLAIDNDTFTRRVDGQVETRPLPNDEALREALERWFGIVYDTTED